MTKEVAIERSGKGGVGEGARWLERSKTGSGGRGGVEESGPKSQLEAAERIGARSVRRMGSSEKMSGPWKGAGPEVREDMEAGAEARE